MHTIYTWQIRHKAVRLQNLQDYTVGILFDPFIYMYYINSVFEWMLKKALQEPIYCYYRINTIILSSLIIFWICSWKQV